MARRRLLIYSPLGESRPFYRPRHAAPSLLLRLARQLSLALLRAHQLVGYYPPSRHRRRPGIVQPQWPRLATATVMAPRGLSPYPVFSVGPARGPYPVFSAGQARVAGQANVRVLAARAAHATDFGVTSQLAC